MNSAFKGILQIALGVVLSALVICLAFPHIPGVQFTGDVGSAIGITLAEMAVSVVLFIVGIILAVIANLKYGWFKAKTAVPMFEKLGYYGTGAVSVVAIVVARALALLIVAAMASSLTISGVVPALLASLALGAVTVPFWLFTGNSRKEFDKKVAELKKTYVVDEVPPATSGETPAVVSTETPPPAGTDATPPAEKSDTPAANPTDTPAPGSGDQTAK